MQACRRRRDPYHGIMRSATVGYPQTVVIMDTLKRTDADEPDGHLHTNTEASQSYRQPAAGEMTTCPFGEKSTPLTGYDKLNRHPLSNQFHQSRLPLLISNSREIKNTHRHIKSIKN